MFNDQKVSFSGVQPSGNLTIGNLSEFEDILSDGELPF